jgi:hypothetical protein
VHFSILHDLQETSRSARFRHQSWAHSRRRVHAAMMATRRPVNRCNSFAACGCNAQVMQADNDVPLLPDGSRQLKITATYCHDRLCVPCGNARSAEIARCLAERIRGKELKFITLTIAGQGESLGKKMDRLYKGFRALRQMPIWQQAIAGGAAFLEIKWSQRSKRWHPHFHLICEGSFIASGKLANIWHAITGDSFIVDVRAVRDELEVSRYVTKYASKPLDMTFVGNPDLLQEAIVALHGRRLCFAFGTWYKTRLHEVDFQDSPGHNYTPLCDLEDLLRDAEHGDAASLQLIETLHLTRRWQAYCVAPP